MPVIGLTADLHLHEHAAFARSVDGVNSRLLDCANAFKRVVDRTKEAGGATVIVAGDWHHSRKQIRVPVLDVGADALAYAAKKGVDVLMVLGNHDLSLDGRTNSVDGLRFADIITEVCVKVVAGTRIGFLPWTDDAEQARQAYQTFEEESVDFVVGHAGISGAKVGPSDFEIEGHVPVEATRDVLSFLGHYHKPQQVEGTRTFYLGSPLQLSWGEADENKSFTLVNKGGSWVKRVPLPEFPRFVVVPPDGVGSVRPQDFVKVVAASAEQAAKVRAEVRKERPQQEVTVTVDAAPVVAMTKPLGATQREQIEAWMEVRPLPEGVTHDEAMKVAQEFLAGA